MQLGALTESWQQRPRSAKTSVTHHHHHHHLLCSNQLNKNIAKVEELMCSQENAPGTYKSPQKIQQIAGVCKKFYCNVD